MWKIASVLNVIKLSWDLRMAATMDEGRMKREDEDPTKAPKEFIQKLGFGPWVKPWRGSRTALSLRCCCAEFAGRQP